MPRARIVRLRHLTAAGIPVTIESRPGRTAAQLRWRDGKSQKTCRATMGIPIRDANGQRSPAHLARLRSIADRMIDEYLASHAARDGGASGPATLATAFARALDATTTKTRSDSSQQLLEWDRASREALAALGPARAVRDLSAHDGKLLVQSAFLRQAAGVTIDAWAARLDALRADRPLGTLLTLEGLLGAYRDAAPEVALDGRVVKGRRWCELSVQLTRAMLNHVAGYAPKEFDGAQNFALRESLDVLLAATAKQIHVTVRSAENRSRPALSMARNLLLLLRDPRHEAYDLLASAAGRRGAYRVKRSHIAVSEAMNGWRIRNTASDGRVIKGYTYITGTDAAYFERLLSTTFAAHEARWQRDATDYAFLIGHRWDGEALVDDSTTQLVYLDPRLRLLLDLFLEGRTEQAIRLRYRDLYIVEGDGMAIMSAGSGTKAASDLLLAPTQMRSVTFAMSHGFLSNMLRAYDATKHRQRNGQQPGSDDIAVFDFPLFPAGELVRGRSPVTARSLKSADDRTIWDWNEVLLKALGLPVRGGTALRNWRRLCVDLYRSWGVPDDVHGLVTGHRAQHVGGKVHTGQDTLGTVYFDPRNLHLHREAQEVMEHLRTTYVASGAPYRPA